MSNDSETHDHKTFLTFFNLVNEITELLFLKEIVLGSRGKSLSALQKKTCVFNDYK